MKKLLFIYFLLIIAMSQCSEEPSKSHIVKRPYHIPLPLTAFELYGWKESGKEFFTLVTLTEKEKTIEEITADDNKIDRPQWMRMKIESLDSIQFLLKGLPKKSLVIWKGSPEGYRQIESNKLDELFTYCRKIDIHCD